MYFDDAEGRVFRPPSEAESFILRITVGCSHNKCTYCNMYRDVRFRVRSMEEIKLQIERAAHYGNYIRRVFLADGDALILPTERLLEVLAELQEKLPKLQRVSCYSSPKSILLKSHEDLLLLRKAGLQLMYYGLETGSDQVLHDVNKGVNAHDAILAGQKVVAAGIKLSLMVILGLAGKQGSHEHAVATAQAINLIQPNMLSALSLMLYRGSELLDKFERGEFEPLNPQELMQELQEMLQNIDLPTTAPCIFRSSHPSNYVMLAATLPKDKKRLCQEVAVAAQKLAGVPYDVYNNVE